MAKMNPFFSLARREGKRHLPLARLEAAMVTLEKACAERRTRYMAAERGKG